MKWTRRSALQLLAASATLLFASHQAGATAVAQADQYLPPERRAAAVESLVDRFHEAGRFDGVLLAAVGDEIVYRGAKGLANHEFGIPNRPETVFRLASVTKQFTATAVLRLVEQGRVELRAPVGRYVPSLDRPGWEGVTLRRLLTHTAGIPRDVEALVDKDLGDHFEMDEMVGILAAAPLIAEPGSQFSYSNAGYVLLAAVIEAVTGRTYGAALQDLLFEPLGMEDTGHETRGAVIPNFAQGYHTLPDRKLRSEYEDKSYVTGAGSTYSNVDDLFTWIQALRSGRVLHDSLVNELTRRQEAGYGYGWFAFTYGPGVPPGQTIPEDAEFHAVAHAGAAPGFATNVRVYLDHDVTVIALSNDERANPQSLSNKVGNLLLGIPDTVAPTAASHRPYEVALREGIEPALDLWDGAAAEALPDEGHLNSTAYQYLGAGLVPEALTLLELQVRLFPESANARDSLGEGYLHAGRVAEARAAYEKALELDPEFENARTVLEYLDRHPEGGLETLP